MKRIIIFSAVILIALYLTFFYTSESIINHSLVFVFAMFSFISLNLLSKNKKLLNFEILLFTFLILISYNLKFNLILSNIPLYKGISFGGIGNFDFTENSIFNALFISMFGIFGVILGLAANFLTRNKSKNEGIIINSKYFNIFLFMSFFSIYLIEFLLRFYGFGMIGVDRPLPFKLNGLIYYFRNFVSPVIGFSFLDIALRSKSKFHFKLTFLLLIIGALITAYTSLSRGPLVNIIFPIIVFLYLDSVDSVFKISLKTKIIYGFIFGVSLIIIMPLITEMRYIIWSKGTINLNFFIKNSVNFENSFSLFKTFITERSIGIQELMAVLGSPSKNIYSLSLFLKSIFNLKFLTDFVNSEIFLSKNYSYLSAASPGLFGLLIMSNSAILLVIGTFLVTRYVYLTSYYFYRRGFKITSYFLLNVLILDFWGAGFIQAITGTMCAFLTFFSVNIIFKKYLVLNLESESKS